MGELEADIFKVQEIPGIGDLEAEKEKMLSEIPKMPKLGAFGGFGKGFINDLEEPGK